MIKDGMRYLPILGECEYRESLWEVKTILPQNELNDGRPILFKKDHGIKNYNCILGGKIDNVYDILDELHGIFSTEKKEKVSAKI